jgi:hypothetical protein
VIKKTIYLLLFTLLSLQTGFGQSITWQRLYDYFGILEKVQQTLDGGYIASGVIRFYPLPDKIILMKLNSYGDTNWVKLFGLNNPQGHWVEQTLDMGFIIGGQDSGKPYLVKTDSLGNMQWDKRYFNDQTCRCVKQISDGGYILAGNSGIVLKTVFIKVDSNGNVIWQKVYGDGVNRIFLNEIVLTNSGFIAACTIGLQQSADVYIMKLNLNGDTLWTKRKGGNDFDGANSIDKIGNEGFVIGGESRSFSSNNKIESYVIKIDTNGQTFWQRTYSNVGYEECNSIKYKPNTGYVLCGDSDSTGLQNFNEAKIRIVDLNGNPLYENSFYPGEDENSLYSIDLTSDGGFIFSGYANLIPGGTKALVVKTDSLGRAIIIGIQPISSTIPQSFNLHQNYPNPFNPVTTIRFDIPAVGTVPRTVRLIIYDVLGRQIATLVNENLTPGTYEAKWEASNLASGMYFYKLTSGEFTAVKKMVLIK